MKRKEQINLAKKIATCELKLQTTSDSKEAKRLEQEIMELCGKVTSMEDMVAVDSYAEEILEKVKKSLT